MGLFILLFVISFIIHWNVPGPGTGSWFGK